jgi:hypothetical protein
MVFEGEKHGRGLTMRKLSVIVLYRREQKSRLARIAGDSQARVLSYKAVAAGAAKWRGPNSVIIVVSGPWSKNGSWRWMKKDEKSQAGRTERRLKFELLTISDMVRAWRFN